MEPLLLFFYLGIGIPIYVFFAATFHLGAGVPSGWPRTCLWIAASFTVLWVLTAGLTLMSSRSARDAGIALLPLAGATVVIGSLAFLAARFRVQGWPKDLFAALIAIVVTTLIFNRYLVPMF